MISFQNGLGLFLTDKLRGRSLVERWTCWCRLLRNCSLVLCNSSLACACSSFAARETSIYAIRRFCRSSCSARASARSLSYSALASSWICSWLCTCSRLCSSLASWRALMAFMSCYKMGASLPSDPCGPCLCFSSRQNAQSRMRMGPSFTGPHGGRQMLSPVGWMGKLTSSLSPLGALK